jgi:hypothetical protein
LKLLAQIWGYFDFFGIFLEFFSFC